jgi:hypothetical protein
MVESFTREIRLIRCARVYQRGCLIELLSTLIVVTTASTIKTPSAERRPHDGA